MASEKQKSANRRNAQRPTGARTDAGKRIAKINAIRHGLSAEQILLPSEDSAQLAELRDKVHEAFQPVGWLEENSVEMVVGYCWRLRRVPRIEAGILIFVEQERRAPAEVVRAAVAAGAPVTHIPAEPEAAARHLERRETVDLARSFLDAAVPLQLLSRYETAIYRKLKEALKALETAQAARLGDDYLELRAPNGYR